MRISSGLQVGGLCVFVWASLWTRATADDVVFSIEPASVSVATNREFSSNIRLQAPDGNPGAFQIVLVYNPSVLCILSVKADLQTPYWGNLYADTSSFKTGFTRIAAVQTTRTTDTVDEVVFTVQWLAVGKASQTSMVSVCEESVIDYNWRYINISNVPMTVKILDAQRARPLKVTTPFPAQLATGVTRSTQLSWTAGTGATGYRVNFGTGVNPPLVGVQAGTTYNPGMLANNTTYYWRIDSTNVAGVTTGDVWQFTTVMAPSATISVGANPSSGGIVRGGGAYTVGQPVQISASANSGWTFTEWSDGNTQNPRTITVPLGGASYTANFQQQVKTGPDFVVTGTRPSLYPLRAGRFFTAYVNVKNQGNAAGNAGTLSMWADHSGTASCGEAANKSVQVGTLAVGQTKRITVTGVRLTAKPTTQTYRLFIDGRCITAEMREDNNQFTGTYTITR